MDKKIIIIAGAILALLLLGLAAFFYWQENNSAKKAIEDINSISNKATENAAKGALPSLQTNPLENKPDLNPVSKTNPYENIKTNPFE